MRMITKAIARVDAVSIRALLLVDLGLAIFVGIAHGGGLLVALAQDSPMLGFIRPVAIVSLPVAGLVIVTSLAALARPLWRLSVLTGHSIVLCLASLATLGWAVSLLVGGIPVCNFAWSPGLMSVFCAYPFYLLRRTLLRSQLPRSFFVQHLHMVVLVAALVVDFGVFIRFVVSIPEMQREMMRQIEQRHNQ